jgi:hypothetical protein
LDRALSERFEHGGYIVERNGEIELVEFRRLSDELSLCGIPKDGSQVLDLLDDPAVEILGQVHTHPVSRDTRVRNPGTCTKWEERKNGRIRRVNYSRLDHPFLPLRGGTHDDDIDDWEDGRQWPGYVLDSENVHRWKLKGEFGEEFDEDRFQLHTGGNACIGN